MAAPLLAAEGCVGALTAEILAGSETTDGIQAMAALVAAQLTGVLASPATAAPDEAADKPDRHGLGPSAPFPNGLRRRGS